MIIKIMVIGEFPTDRITPKVDPQVFEDMMNELQLKLQTHIPVIAQLDTTLQPDTDKENTSVCATFSLLTDEEIKKQQVEAKKDARKPRSRKLKPK